MMVTDDSTLTTPLLSGNSSWKNQQTFSNEIQFESNKVNNRGECNVTYERLSWEDLFPQILASVVAFMLVTQPGINMVYSNIFLNHYKFTDVSELSWLSSILVLCMPVGAITIGVVMDRIGRKNAFLLTCVPLLISWSIASVARPENMHLIYTCRFFAGIGGGMTSMVVIYVSEITHSSYRQVLLSLNAVFFSVGVLFATAVGSLFRWQTVNVIFVIFTAFTVVLLIIFLPESPVWLTKFRADRILEAKSSLKRIYPKNDQVFAEEWERLYYVRPQSLSQPPSLPVIPHATLAPSSDYKKRRSRVRRLWQRRPRWWLWSQPPTVNRPVRVLAVLFLLQQLSGCYPVIFYAVPIIRSLIGTAGGPSQMDTLIALGVGRLLASIVACVLSPHVGRRPLLMASSLAMAFSAALVALTCPSTVSAIDEYVADYVPLIGGEPSPTPILPLIGIAAFVCSGSAGVIVFPWTLVGEMLPVSARAVAGALLVSYAYVLMFVVLKAFPYFIASDDGGGDGSVAAAFVVFAAVSLAMTAYVHAYLPETQGKPIHEIEGHFEDPPWT